MKKLIFGLSIFLGIALFMGGTGFSQNTPDGESGAASGENTSGQDGVDQVSDVISDYTITYTDTGKVAVFDVSVTGSGVLSVSVGL